LGSSNVLSESGDRKTSPAGIWCLAGLALAYKVQRQNTTIRLELRRPVESVFEKKIRSLGDAAKIEATGIQSSTYLLGQASSKRAANFIIATGLLRQGREEQQEARNSVHWGVRP
jgi:hypothetical protein